MYLAAIADSQPQPPTVHAQFSPNAAMQPGAHYLQHRQPQQMTPQAALMAARSPMLYAQQPLSALQQHQHQQQQALHSQLAMTSSAANNGLHMLHSDTTNLGGSGGAMVSGGFPDFGRGSGSSGNLGSGSGNLGSTSDAMAGGSRDRKADLVGGDMQNSDGRGASSSAQNADASEPLYLKASEEEGN
ncbi:GRF1-interacting factor 1 isoform X2 [Amborella trichopoda]|nr:GRF1-interacting factor 1 isoform X2 [Amborella trichopoda]|eukprot:XP_020521616.1 GRF1-interacting factor 1 isoform X2 [Amborella trichopoda]